MHLTPGTRLGPYEIVAKLGEGGMGEVYRARDARLNRDVAVKVLPEHFADDAERLARFTREAQTLASLNHPNIAHIHGLEESDGIRALIMELVEGDDLSTVIERGPMPVAEALPIARQLAEALEAAHELGIVHRDLKPANIKIRGDGTVKVLDFGLAKAIDPTATSGVNSAKSPTLTARATQLGMIIGTAAYMAPEQARGKPVDRRADVWAFGVVLYEMLTGERAFTGEEVSDVLAAVLRQDIDWTRLPAATPSRVRDLLRRCLEKDPKLRLQAVGEARIALAQSDEPSGIGSMTSSAGAAAVGPRGSHRAWLWAIAALALAGWAATAAVWFKHTPAGSSELRTSIALPDGLGIPTLLYYGNGSVATIAVSPAGDQVAFVAFGDGEGALYIRRLDSFDAVRLTNTEGAAAPFFSPDGKRLGFFARGHLWRIDLPGGVPVELAPAALTSVGGRWGDDGRIVYTPGFADALWTIPSGGGQAHELTKVDRAAGEVSHRWPCILPGGKGVLFTIKQAANETFDDAAIAIADAATGEHHVLIQGGSMPGYLDSGQIVFARSGKLYAVGFDLATRAIHGAPAPVLDGVATGPMTGAAWYDVTRNGFLAYAPGGRVIEAGRFSWEGTGHAAQILDRLNAENFGGGVRLSRDFKRAVIQIAGANDKLWLIDLEQMNTTRLTAGGGNDNPGLLSPDGRWLLFVSDRDGGGYHFFRMPLGGGEPQPLMAGNGQLNAITYPAHMLGFSSQSTKDGSDAYVMSVAEDGSAAGKPILVAGGPGDQSDPAVSADGTLVAYQSVESGRGEIYVARLADLGARRRMTNDGGAVPLWSRDGSRLFYLSNNRVYSETLRSAPELRFDAPQAVTGADAKGEIVAFDVAPDGTSVLVARVADPLMLRGNIRLWPGWGKTLPAVE
jgi:eukaryotic-like serine/threonine-protein kinase